MNDNKKTALEIFDRLPPKAQQLINAYIDAEGNTLYGEYDLMPILESFIKEHPDFSKPYLEHLLKGVSPQIQNLFMENLQNLFSAKNR